MGKSAETLSAARLLSLRRWEIVGLAGRRFQGAPASDPLWRYGPISISGSASAKLRISRKSS
jgi:hypothetical protein